MDKRGFAIWEVILTILLVTAFLGSLSLYLNGFATRDAIEDSPKWVDFAEKFRDLDLSKIPNQEKEITEILQASEELKKLVDKRNTQEKDFGYTKEEIKRMLELNFKIKKGFESQEVMIIYSQLFIRPDDKVESGRGADMMDDFLLFSGAGMP